MGNQRAIEPGLVSAWRSSDASRICWGTGSTRSRPGEGSIFSIELPLAMTETAGLPVLGDAGSGQNGRGRLVVVIDDDALVLESLEAILTEWGYQAIAAVSAEEAVAQVRS